MSDNGTRETYGVATDHWRADRFGGARAALPLRKAPVMPIEHLEGMGRLARQKSTDRKPEPADLTRAFSACDVSVWNWSVEAEAATTSASTTTTRAVS
jgi:hypothetical protein